MSKTFFAITIALFLLTWFGMYTAAVIPDEEVVTEESVKVDGQSEFLYKNEPYVLVDIHRAYALTSDEDYGIYMPMYVKKSQLDVFISLMRKTVLQKEIRAQNDRIMMSGTAKANRFERSRKGP